MKSADRGIIHCNAVKWGHIVTAFKDDKMRIIHCNAVKWGHIVTAFKDDKMRIIHCNAVKWALHLLPFH